MHIGAILYACEVSVRTEGAVTCTGERSKWRMPSYVKHTICASVRDGPEVCERNANIAYCQLDSAYNPYKRPTCFV